MTPFQVNVPLVISNVGIFPGDYIYADSSGALGIPNSQVGEARGDAIEGMREDAGYLDMIRQEDPSTPTWGER